MAGGPHRGEAGIQVRPGKASQTRLSGPGPQAFRIATGCVALHGYYPGGPDKVTAIWATALAQSAPAAPLTAESIMAHARPRPGRSSSRPDPQLASAGTRLAAFGVPRPVTGSQPFVAG